jgi:two-component system, NtrC family, response regulator AtoC
LTTPFLNSDNADVFHHIIETMGNASMGVQLSGEKGLCKETIVRLLYAGSAHCGSPFIKVNCPVLSVPERTGNSPCINTVTSQPNVSGFSLFRLFHQGVLYLHTVDQLDVKLQAYLLVLLKRKFLASDCSSNGTKGGMLVFSTSTRPLDACVAAGHFNPELCELLSGLSIHIPPLRHSVDRIPQLVDYFINQHTTREGRKGISQPSSSQLATMNAYPWPGNVKELQEMVTTALRHGWDSGIRMLKRNRRAGDNGQPVDLSPDGVALMPGFEIRLGRMLNRLAGKNPIEEMGLMDLVIYDEVMAHNKVH